MSTRSAFIEINGRRVGTGYPTYVIAEVSANHHQSFDQAVRLVEAAKETGADAVKLQTYTPDTMTLDVDSDLFRHGEGSLWAARTLHDLYSEGYMPWEWVPRLKDVAEQVGIELFSTAYDVTAVEFLEQVGVAAHKIASFEIIDVPLIEKMAQTGKPVILSTGMASLDEIEEAVGTARRAGARQIALLKCTSAYPAPVDEMNLRTIPHLAETLGLPVGLSDHSLGIAIPPAAVAVGACMVEKHFTLSRGVPGPDSAFSLEPDEFKAMVEAIRMTERALGRVAYGPSGAEAQSLAFRRSLFVVKDMQAGDRFTEDNVRPIRSAAGLHPRSLKGILGRRAAKEIRRGTPLTWAMIIE